MVNSPELQAVRNADAPSLQHCAALIAYFT